MKLKTNQIRLKAKMSRNDRGVELPRILVDREHNLEYEKGKFLGKGGFAKCYEFTRIDNKKLYAGKVVPKSLLQKSHQKEKMAQEIKLHKELDHKHIVKFVSSFQDANFVFVVLEICKKKSMMELHKRRGPLTEPEVRYYMKQICLGLEYLHDQKIIHRDLKLGNIFLDDKMQVKLGDFGLATVITFDGERKRTLCGTPNYIAPEILTKAGHSVEVDIWSTGCIMYTLLVGKPPFETTSLKETYKKIKMCEYIIPEDKVGTSAQHLITSMLHAQSSQRPKVGDILQHEFINVGYMPRSLPSSALTIPPSFTRDQMTFSTTSRPMPEYEQENVKNDDEFVPRPIVRKSLAPRPQPYRTKLEEIEEKKAHDLQALSNMVDGLSRAFKNNPRLKTSEMLEECQRPASVATYWISKWVDYSDKYGIGYQLCDNSVGVLYNDSTRIVLHQDGDKLQYVDKDCLEKFCSVTNHPIELKKKVSLVDYFRKYMNEHLLKAGSQAAPKEGDDICRLPMLRTWFRTRSAICLWLSDGCMQINWFESHQKLVFCPNLEAITELKQDGSTVTYTKELLMKNGFTENLQEKLRYAGHMIKKLKSAPNPGRNTATAR